MKAYISVASRRLHFNPLWQCTMTKLQQQKNLCHCPSTCGANCFWLLLGNACSEQPQCFRKQRQFFTAVTHLLLKASLYRLSMFICCQYTPSKCHTSKSSCVSVCVCECASTYTSKPVKHQHSKKTELKNLSIEQPNVLISSPQRQSLCTGWQATWMLFGIIK